MTDFPVVDWIDKVDHFAFQYSFRLKFWKGISQAHNNPLHSLCLKICE